MSRLPLLCPLLCAAAAIAAEPAERSVLFIGNSLTIRNDLPALVAGLAQAGGHGPLTTDAQLVGGATLKRHWQEGKALAKLQGRPWTWVVIQDQSMATIDAPDDFAVYGRKFIEAALVRKSRPALYLTWAKVGDLAMQERISAAYRRLGAETGSLVVPAGQAFADYRARHGDVVLFSDDRHPSPAGSYLAACCFYRALFAADPTGLPVGALAIDAVTARTLQGFAAAAR